MKLFKKIFVALFCIVFACGCSDFIPIIPTPDTQEEQTLCSIVTNSDIEGTAASTSSKRMSVNTYKDVSKSTVKIAACYTVKNNEVDLETSGFIFDKSYDADTSKYTYYIATSSSGVFYRYIGSIAGEAFNGETDITTVRNGTFEMIFEDGHRYIGDLVGYYDPYDVAVFKFESKEDYDVLVFGDSDQVEVGDEMFLYGSPTEGFDLLNSLTKGYISGLNREASVNYNGKYLTQTYSYNIATYSSFQFDAAVNDGMEGGPIVNNDGELIGMCSYRYSSSSTSYESLSFGIASNDINPILKSIVNTGTFEKPMLGVSVIDIYYVMYATSDNFCEWLNKYNVTEGVYVTYDNGVDPTKPMGKAGCEDNCVITKIVNNGHEYKITNRCSLYSALVRIDKSKMTEVTVVRPNSGLLTGLKTETYNISFE